MLPKFCNKIIPWFDCDRASIGAVNAPHLTLPSRSRLTLSVRDVFVAVDTMDRMLGGIGEIDGCDVGVDSGLHEGRADG